MANEQVIQYAIWRNVKRMARDPKLRNAKLEDLDPATMQRHLSNKKLRRFAKKSTDSQVMQIKRILERGTQKAREAQYGK